MTSIRSQCLQTSANPLVDAYFRCQKNPYSLDNPDGYVNLGTAENFLLGDVLLERLSSLEGPDVTDLRYTSGHGQPEARRVVARFIEHFFSRARSIDFNRVTIASGAGAILEMLSYVLFDKGDRIVVPAPYFPGFKADMATRFETELISSHCYDSRGNLDFTELRGSLEEVKPKALLICNPVNPLGTILTLKQMEKVVSLCKEFKVELIADEVYGLSVFGSQKFESFLNLDTEYRDHVHGIYSLAKDLGLSGFKVGWLYSENADVNQRMQNAAYFHQVSGFAQYAIKEILADFEWVLATLEQSRKLLNQNFKKVQAFCDHHQIDVVGGEAGLFCWIDLSKKFKMKHQEDEMKLFDQLVDNMRLNLSPGSAFNSNEFGHFRLCFAYQDELLKEGLKRLDQALRQMQ